jgi:CxxC motif-containing protein (DUF1111 family)
LKLNFNGVPVGRIRHVEGGVGKFGWKGQFATLEEFVAAACANELGLSTPTTAAAKPLANPGYESPGPDLDKKQFRSLVAFVKTLPKPIEVEGNPVAAQGKHLFGAVGCAVCHVPDMGGVRGVYSDFLLYTLDDPTVQSGRGGGGGGYGSPPPPQLQLADRPDHEPKPEEWKTPALWGVADSAPYLHDGSAETLEDAIARHQGDAKGVTAKFEALSPQDQAALIAFLSSLKAPPDATPLRDPAITRLARR